ncbi:hypothetical protein TNCV_3663731 [Trichonephila clavipes]|nr:hypothetical protein TNCV_3663731 [Trichonephila clavipes]
MERKKKLCGDGPRNFEPWSSDKDGTRVGIPSPNFHIMTMGGCLSLDRFNVHRLPQHDDRVGTIADFVIHQSDFQRPTALNSSLVPYLERGVPVQVSSTSLDHGSKLHGPSPKALVLLNSTTLIFTHSLTRTFDLNRFNVHQLLYMTGILWHQGRGSLVVQVTDLWLACHEFEPSTAEDPSCRGAMHVKSVEAQTSSRWCGVEVRRWCQLRCCPHSLCDITREVNIYVALFNYSRALG